MCFEVGDTAVRPGMVLPQADGAAPRGSPVKLKFIPRTPRPSPRSAHWPPQCPRLSRSGTADPDLSEPGIWVKVLQIGAEKCSSAGRFELMLLLDPAGVEGSHRWKSGEPITIPSNTRTLDSIFVSRTDRGW